TRARTAVPPPTPAVAPRARPTVPGPETRPETDSSAVDHGSTPPGEDPGGVFSVRPTKNSPVDNPERPGASVWRGFMAAPHHPPPYRHRPALGRFLNRP